MFVSKNLGVNEDGNLTIAGMDTTKLAKQYTTPLYVIDEETIRNNCRLFKNSIDKFYNGKGLVFFASKALSCKEMYRIIASENLGIDVVSPGELHTAMSVDFPAKKIAFHGNNKTEVELKTALEYGVGYIVVDNLEELIKLNKLAISMGKVVDIMFRIKPGIDAHTHDFIRTGQIDSKFGVALETGEALDIIKTAITLSGINISGIHCHIGSQIFDITPFVEAAKVMLGLIAEIKSECGIEIQNLNLGGGFGIKYMPDENPVKLSDYMEKVSIEVNKVCKQLDIKKPFIMLEPGRSIVAEAGITLYTVGSVKHIPNLRTYVAIDGSMCDNPRYALYQSKYTAEVANKATKPKDTVITLAGRCCESGDLIGENMPLQETEEGDIIAVCATGAYTYSMASNYNRLPKPAIVMVNKGESRVIVKRETLDDVMRNDI